MIIFQMSTYFFMTNLKYLNSFTTTLIYQTNLKKYYVYIYKYEARVCKQKTPIVWQNDQYIQF